MVPDGVDEQVELRSPIFPSLVNRKRPLVLRNAAGGWGGHAFLQSPGVAGLKVAWRLHLLEPVTVWEADCHVLEATVGQFLAWEQSVAPLPAGSNNPFEEFDRQTHWAYADYKHVKELEDDWSKVLEPVIDWPSLGCDKAAVDSTVWLGTEGSHTPLHHDTYGINLVAQLHGRKRWLFYSPEHTASLYPTRIPYEESSVFSKVDARAPDFDTFPRLADARPLVVTLEPGDVLFVPKHWWHFVEAVDTSLSVNVWVDAPDDAHDRAKEALARVLVTSLAGGLEAEASMWVSGVGPTWLNPTEDEVWPLEETIQVAGLAFQGLETYTEGNSSNHGDKKDARVRKDGAFSVRAMIDSITAPDVLHIVVDRMLQGRDRNTNSPPDTQASPS